MINCVKIILFFILLGMSNDFFNDNSNLYGFTSLILAVMIILNLMHSIILWFVGYYAIDKDTNWFDDLFYDDGQSYSNSCYYGQKRDSYSQSHHTVCDVNQDAIILNKLTKKKNKLEVVSESVRKVDIDNTPISSSPKTYIADQPSTTIEVVEYKADNHIKSCDEAIVVFNNNEFTPSHSMIYGTILGCLKSLIQDKEMLFHVIQCIYHIDLLPNRVDICYRKCMLRFKDYILPKDEIEKAIKYRVGDKNFEVKFIEMKNKTITEYYIEETIKSK